MDYEKKKYKEAEALARDMYVSMVESGVEVMAEKIAQLFPQVTESEDERIRKELSFIVSNMPYMETELRASGLSKEQVLAWLEKQKESVEKEYVFRPLPGTVITTAAEQAIEKAKKGEHLVLAFNGIYIPVTKYNNVKELVGEYYVRLEKQKEQKPIEDVVKDITENKESAIKFLKSAGIMDENGELAEMYRSEQEPAE